MNSVIFFGLLHFVNKLRELFIAKPNVLHIAGFVLVLIKLGILEKKKFNFSHFPFSMVYFVCFKQVLIIQVFTPNNDMSIKGGATLQLS